MVTCRRKRCKSKSASAKTSTSTRARRKHRRNKTRKSSKQWAGFFWNRCSLQHLSNSTEDLGATKKKYLKACCGWNRPSRYTPYRQNRCAIAKNLGGIDGVDAMVLTEIRNGNGIPNDEQMLYMEDRVDDMKNKLVAEGLLNEDGTLTDLSTKTQDNKNKILDYYDVRENFKPYRPVDENIVFNTLRSTLDNKNTLQNLQEKPFDWNTYKNLFKMKNNI